MKVNCEKRFNGVPDLYQDGPVLGIAPNEIFTVYGPYIPFRGGPSPSKGWVLGDNLPSTLE